MATISELARLFKAIGAGDLAAATTAAAAISEREEKHGHRAAARILKGSLQANGTRSSNGAANQHSVRGLVLADALTRLDTPNTFASVRLRRPARVEFDNLVAEWHRRADLQSHGLHRRARLLFHGPPGCGKSLSACALGNELGLPVYVVRFDAVIGAFLGQTALHLRELFRFAEVTPCLLLIDEVDVLGKKRGNPLDVGELDRIVVTLMQELEHANPLGFVIATSNLPHHLDDALARRFDLVLAFPRPTKREISAFARDLATRLSISLSASARRTLGTATSYSDAERAVESLARRVLLASLAEGPNGG